MVEHIESAAPKPRPKSEALQGFEAALAEAKAHLDRIPRHNARAREIQLGIIQQWERQVAAAKGESWLTV